jgi:hypothetical protein
MKSNRPSADDWRRQGQEAFLQACHLRHTAYTPYRVGWEHDHCEFCGKKFSTMPPDLTAGYSTEDLYHWICESCFADFVDEFEWTVD